MTRITKRQARKLFAEGKMIVLCPCKMSPEGPFSMAAWISSKEWARRAEITGSQDPWINMIDTWRYYNASYECGYYPHYYVG